MTNNVLFTINADGVAKITLNRPELHNAFDDDLIKNFLEILQNINQDPVIRVVILEALGKSFSAGADLNWMRRMVSYTYDQNVQDALQLSELMHTLKFLKQPTIARVHGAVFGGGVGLVSCCDMAIVSKQATFCLSEVKIGLIPAVISPYVISIMGERASRRYFLTGEQMDAMQALQLGLATEVVDSEQLDDSIDKITQHLLSNSPQAVMAAKQLINQATVHTLHENHLQKNAEAIAAIRISPEGQEGLTAFLEKRKPIWKS